jgi:K+-transporting ATPase KdpF subunit
MTFILIFAGFVVLALLIYLFITLLKPEWFE